MIVHALFCNEPGRDFTLMGVYTTPMKAMEAWEVYKKEFLEDGEDDDERLRAHVIAIEVDDEASIIEP